MSYHGIGFGCINVGKYERVLEKSRLLLLDVLENVPKDKSKKVLNMILDITDLLDDKESFMKFVKENKNYP